MLFDRLCKASEVLGENWDLLRKYLKIAALFDLRGLEKEKEIAYADQEEVFETVGFPFSVVCLEDRNSLVMLSALDAAHIYEKVRVNGKVEAYKKEMDRIQDTTFRNLSQGIWAPKPGLEKKTIAFGVFEGQGSNSIFLQGGFFPALRPTREDSNLLGIGGAIQLFAAEAFQNWEHRHVPSSKDKLFGMQRDSILLQGMANTVGFALRELWYIQQPGRWVVRVSKTTKDRHKPKPGQIRRSHQRTRYIVVSDKELPRFIGPESVPLGERRKLLHGHRRRGHWKRLQSPRFRFKKGKVVWTRPTWVGPKEGVRGREHYEVLVES